MSVAPLSRLEPERLASVWPRPDSGADLPAGTASPGLARRGAIAEDLMQIDMTGIVCRFGSTPAVDGVDLAIARGEFLALLGPSGSGKTTLLRVVAGLEKPEAGRLRIEGQDATDLPPNKRRIGFVFQNYALFRHMSVARNIAFGLEVRPRRTRPARAEIARRVDELLDLVQLPGLGRRFPHELSGGQRQRVALARALATEPEILLLDEPFGALDAKVRAELRVWLRQLHRELGITSVFVTHDQEEAMELADRVVIMRQGRIHQAGAPQDIYAAPASGFVYNFLGPANKLAGRVAACRAGVPGTPLSWPAPELADGAAEIWFRPHEVELLPAAAEPAFEGRILDVTTAGPRARLTLAANLTLATNPTLETGGATIAAELELGQWQALALSRGLSPGQPCRWRPRRVQIYAG